MRIVAVEIDHLALPLDPPFHANWDPVPRTTAPATVVRVVTDAGLVGVGGGDTLAGIEPHLGALLGTDPLAIEPLVRILEDIDFHGPRPWPLEAAVWDVIGQATNAPVARLLGGATDRLPAYASTGAARQPEAHAEVAQHLVARGFTAVKLRLPARDRLAALAAVTAVRAAVGDALAVMVDLNQGWRMPGDLTRSIDVVAARRIADALAELEVTWLEEPLHRADLAGLAALRRDARVRIAGGEMARTVAEVDAALAADALDVHQPDVVLAGGLWRGRSLAERILAAGRWYSPHTWTDGLGLLANLHVAAGVGGGPWLEYPYDPDGWTPDRRDFPLAEPVTVDADGMLQVPQVAGLGTALDEARVAATRVGGLTARLDAAGDPVVRTHGPGGPR